MAQATITEISDSSDLVWEIVCRFEDGDGWTRAEYAQLSESDRQILTEEVDSIIAKRAKRFEAAQLAEQLQNPPRGFVASPRITGPDYEGMILARQEFEVYGNC